MCNRYHPSKKTPVSRNNKVLQLPAIHYKPKMVLNSSLENLTIPNGLGVKFTNWVIDAVHSLNVSGHGLDAGLFGAHVLVEEVIGLEVEHARPLLDVDLVVRVLAAFPEMVPNRFRNVFPVEDLVSRYGLARQVRGALSGRHGHRHRHVRGQDFELLTPEFRFGLRRRR